MKDYVQRYATKEAADSADGKDKAEEEDEDEAGLHVGNWGCSIAQAGWLHDRAGRPGIWASSDMETFSVWTGEVRLRSCDRYKLR